MKQCSKCKKIYDDNWSICIVDSLPLSGIENSEAEALLKVERKKADANDAKRKKFELFIALALPFIFLGFNIVNTIKKTWDGAAYHVLISPRSLALDLEGAGFDLFFAAIVFLLTAKNKKYILLSFMAYIFIWLLLFGFNFIVTR